jgi:3-phosphoshikimate 1-carboxyvinyltransferase
MESISFHKNISKYADVRLPISKSFSNRLLLISALNDAPLDENYISKAADSKLLKTLLQKIKSESSQKELELYCENAGTVLRFIGPFAAYKGITAIIDGDLRLRSRPIDEMIQMLVQLGINIDFIEKDGHLPLRIKGQLRAFNYLEIKANKSSQHVSALLMLCPLFQEDIQIRIIGKSTSLSYIDMTIGIMQKMGIKIYRKENNITINKSDYFGEIPLSEFDWSAAAFYYNLLLIHPQLSPVEDKRP